MTEKTKNLPYREVDRDLANLYYRLESSHAYETEAVRPDEATHAAFALELEGMRGRIKALGANNAAEKLVVGHFSDFADSLARSVEEYFARPSKCLEAASSRTCQLAQFDSRPAGLRAEALGRYLESLPEALRATAASEASRKLATDDLSHYAANIPRYFPGLSSAEESRLGEAFGLALAAIDSQASLSPESAGAEASDGGHGMREEDYRRLLADVHGVDLGELLSWYASEMEKTREGILKAASRLPLASAPKDVRGAVEALNTYAGAAGSAAEMFELARKYLARTREACREYVKMPEESLALEAVPYPLREYFPWGGYADGDGSLPARGTFFLNDGNFKAVTDGWLKMQAVHEAYPGHHLQYVLSANSHLPETVRIGAKSIPLIEGTAHRSEALFTRVFEEDPYYALFVAYRRHHTAVRIAADVNLRLFSQAVEEVSGLYEKELGFDGPTARGQVEAQLRMEGYFTCYYYGLKRLSELEDASGLGEAAFTGELFSCGAISLKNFEGFLGLDDSGKAAYKEGFDSLLRG